MLRLLKDNKEQVYWLCQFSGWGIYALFNILLGYSYAADKFTRGSVMFFILVWFCGIVVTHIFRSLIKSQKWTDLEPVKIIYRVLAFAPLLGIVLYLLPHTLISVTFSELRLEADFIRIMVYVFNLIGAVLLWSFIYLAVIFSENYQRSEIERFIWEAAVKDFELKTLKSQLNPHFMFNAMNGIRALIEIDPPRAKSAITELSNIMRYSLKIERSETVMLEEEIKTVADYLSLEQIRYEERLKFEIKINPSVNKFEIPPMMIQTLVENGIKHGISKLPGGGRIIIEAYPENSNLKINILNSGFLDEKKMHESTGFGLANTKHRLSLLYGEKASFRIRNTPDNLVESEIIIPSGGIQNENLISR